MNWVTIKDTYENLQTAVSFIITLKTAFYKLKILKEFYILHKFNVFLFWILRRNFILTKKKEKTELEEIMIYLVEDDESIRELVVYTLNSQGLEAQGFERPSLFWKALEKERRRWYFWISCFQKRTAFPF